MVCSDCLLALSYLYWGVIKRHAASLCKDIVLARSHHALWVSHACTFQFGLVLRENCNICWTRYIYICVSQIFIHNISHNCLPMNIQINDQILIFEN
jgi:hypothetical protein